MSPFLSDRQPLREGLWLSRRSTLKGAASLIITAGVSLAVHQSITGQNAPHPAEGTPSASPSASPQASPASVAAAHVAFTTNLRFDPERLTIPPGTAVTWTNTSPMPHTVTGDPDQNPVAASHLEYITLPRGAKPWGSALLQPGDSYSHVFDAPGEYLYICIPHVLSGMRGTIVVER